MKNKKQCTKCRKMKWLEDFHKSSKAHDGLQSRCKPCNVAAKTTNTHTLIIPIEVSGEIIDHRECKDCGDTLPLDSFYSNGRGGSKPRCKMCYNARDRKSKAIRRALNGEFMNDVTKTTK
ncbi:MULTISPECIES: hypothetical protein [Bacillus]|uniref:hypothetical protein n=1 Tax=Bacillus TaxID=1386 RepID=UPI00077AC521|nr:MULTISPECIES: hypothetical protein [Bacillus cereus group]KXX87878.1 hypothetical protein AT266_25495 [Bacillus cereus]MBJ8149272.1 hypothetical protein [Bacillus cereus]MDA2330493.1 hypothetical protein [Bacillus cereus]MDA2336441.1 hypothetical protein [Bacillus cereus]MDA2358070.1 hypothetical protein [Bacillus cereus]